MVARGEIILAHAVALAGVQQVAGTVDAQIADDVLGPAEAVGVVRQPPLGGEHAVAAACRDLAQEIGLVAEQAEAVLDLPDDVEIAGAGELRDGAIERRKGDRARPE